MRVLVPTNYVKFQLAKMEITHICSMVNTSCLTDLRFAPELEITDILAVSLLSSLSTYVFLCIRIHFFFVLLWSSG
jgi:hypothetical protein